MRANLATRYQRRQLGIGATLVVLSALAMVGWALRVPALTHLGLDTHLKLLTAFTLLAFGTALVLEARRPGRRAARALWAFGGVVGALSFVGDLGSAYFGIAQTGWEPIAPNTALCLALIGLTMSVPARGPKGQRLGDVALSLAAFLAFIALSGHLYSVRALHGLPGFGSMAMQTAVAVLLTVAGARSSGPGQLLSRDDAVGRAARRLTLGAPLLVAVGGVFLAGQRAGLYQTEFGLALMVTTSTALLLGLALWTAHLQARATDAMAQRIADQRLALRATELVRVGTEPSEVTLAVAELLREHLAIDACYFSQVDEARGVVRVQHGSSFGGAHAAEVPISSFSPSTTADVLAGKTVVNVDSAVDLRTADRYAAHYGPLQLRAYALLPLRRDDQTVALLNLRSSRPRVWSAEELALMHEVGEKTWLALESQRAHAARDQALAELEALRVDLERRVEARSAELKSSEARFRALFDASPISLWEYDFSEALEAMRALGLPPDALERRLRADDALVATLVKQLKILATNPASLALFEVPDLPTLLKLRPKMHLAATVATIRDELLALHSGAVSYAAETSAETSSGVPLRLQLRLQLVPGLSGRAVISLIDITAQTRRDGQLRASLREKEVLLKEVNHRVKNNLQVISSLMNLQAPSLPEEARAIFEASQSRVHSIALVHERLYETNDVTSVDFGKYVHSLVAHLGHSLDGLSRGVSTEVAVDGVQLPVNQAVPCGLIVNELVTNAFKHAFPAREGRVCIGLKQDGEKRLVLSVADDGVGLPGDVRAHRVRAGSLGMELVHTFAEQLDARVEVLPGPGTTFTFTFDRSS
ncbi:MAG: GAF domain-containing protein [Archangiaceae bacterium]|nr:GAF domain-containing protein [Archangiaceae bacterium]